MTVRFRIMTISGALANFLGHVVLYFDLPYFIMGSLLGLYQTQGLFKICASVTDVTIYSLGKRTHKQLTQKIIVSLIFPHQ